MCLCLSLAVEGLKPFCAVYSTFMQRAYDQVIHDVALQALPVRMVLDRGGLVGNDGATHHGTFDLAYMGCVPGIVIMAPSDEVTSSSSSTPSSPSPSSPSSSSSYMGCVPGIVIMAPSDEVTSRSEDHTSELQSP